MREAIGGSLLFYLIIPILVILIVFVGFIMRYASAYRAANYIITQIESCQGYLDGSCSTYESDDKIKQVLRNKYGYAGSMEKTCLPNGNNSSVYRVVLYVEFDFPLIGEFSPFNVKAETKTLNNRCSS